MYLSIIYHAAEGEIKLTSGGGPSSHFYVVFFAGLLCNTTSILVALFTMAFTRYLVFKVIYINLSEGSYRETNTLLASNRAESCRQNLKLHYLIIYVQTAWNIIIFDIKKEST